MSSISKCISHFISNFQKPKEVPSLMIEIWGMIFEYIDKNEGLKGVISCALVSRSFYLQCILSCRSLQNARIAINFSNYRITKESYKPDAFQMKLSFRGPKYLLATDNRKYYFKSSFQDSLYIIDSEKLERGPQSIQITSFLEKNQQYQKEVGEKNRLYISIIGCCLFKDKFAVITERIVTIWKDTAEKFECLAVFFPFRNKHKSIRSATISRQNILLLNVYNSQNKKFTFLNADLNLILPIFKKCTFKWGWMNAFSCVCNVSCILSYLENDLFLFKQCDMYCSMKRAYHIKHIDNSLTIINSFPIEMLPHTDNFEVSTKYFWVITGLDVLILEAMNKKKWLEKNFVNPWIDTNSGPFYSWEEFFCKPNGVEISLSGDIISNKKPTFEMYHLPTKINLTQTLNALIQHHLESDEEIYFLALKHNSDLNNSMNINTLILDCYTHKAHQYLQRKVMTGSMSDAFSHRTFYLEYDDTHLCEKEKDRID